MAEAPKGTARRDKLISLEQAAQAKWDQAKPFEVDAPEGKFDGGKFLVTFPYPYMNGTLHLGHAFSLSKAEFACAYQRMQGKKALFPFGFHCTGMPIQAAAYKLKKEYELYGAPVPNFPASPPEVVATDAEEGSITIGWKSPTSVGGGKLTGFQVCLMAGGDWKEVAVVPCEVLGTQCSYCVTGLAVGTELAFKVVSVVEGQPSRESKVLDKSADGKHALMLMAAKKEEAKKGEKKGGGGGKPAKPAKIVAKTGGMTTQWDILRSMGISVEDCLPFVDPIYWLQYFPPIGKTDLQRFGCGVDWRRSFITTDFNPYYDSFVRWQFFQLKRGDFIAFGKRPSIFSEADGQPCMDHDRDKGEGVNPQEYTALKMKILEPYPAVLSSLAQPGRTIYCLAATLRPETMCGQTNCWILPDGDYGVFELDANTYYICAPRAARNMAFQDIFPVWGQMPKQLLAVKGKDLLGCAIKAPSTPYERIYMLPLTTISMTKGTAIVTSVPSDSPDDYAAFMDLKNPKKREFYGVQAEWIEPFALIPIIKTEELGDVAAEFMCQKLKVQSQKDVEKLKEAHDVVYTLGFHKGVMTAGPFAGMSVMDAKPLCKKKLCADGEAFTYQEPEGPVFPRSTPDVECVVANVDQYYLKYGEAEWAGAIRKHLETFESYNPVVEKAFKDALAWLSDWACSRSFGLGTRVPWDDKFLIESLSDSTIYMAYYTVAHFLQGGVLDGRTTGPSGITAEQCTPAFWDYVLLGTKYDASIGIPEEKLKPLRREFTFWYPMDLRVSGKDLIPNHLTMSLYNHAAVWKDQPELWPRSFFCNGHVQVDAEKMSKSKGNFISVAGACDTWGADATRFTCADAGDGLLNANYDRVVADRAILTLTTELDWITTTLNGTNKDTKLRPEGGVAMWLDDWFCNEMVRIVHLASKAYEGMRFKEALKFGFYGMQEARDRYRTGTAHVGVRKSLVLQWVEWSALLMTPITPHFSEALWELLGKPGCIVSARWPSPDVMEKPEITSAGNYLFDVSHSLAAALVNRDKKKGKGPTESSTKPNQVNLYVATTFPRWKEIVLEILQAAFNAETSECGDQVMRDIKDNAELNSFNKGKQVPQFAAMVRDEAKTRGAEAFALKMPFDEQSVLRENLPYLCSILGVSAIHLYAADMPCAFPEPEVLASAVPGKPQAHFFFDEVIRTPVGEGAAAAISTPKLSMMEYLEQHNVAVVLNDAVNQLATEQPADPFAWLSSKLGSVAKSSSK